MRLFKKILVVFLFILTCCFLQGCLFDDTEKEQKINEAYNSIMSNINYLYVVSDLDLPSNYQNTVFITWTSSDSNTLNIVSEKGLVYRSITDKTVQLKAVLTYKDLTRTKYQSLTIKAINLDDYSSQVWFSVYEELSKDNLLSAVTSDLSLLKVFGNTNISWTSSDESVVSLNGEVNPKEDDILVVLSSSFVFESIEKSFNYNIWVLGTNNNDSKLDVLIKLFKGKQAINSDLELLTEYEGLSISYESMNPSIIDNNGLLTVPDVLTFVDIKVVISDSDSFLELIISFLVANKLKITEVSYTPYPYQEGGGEGLSSLPISLLDDLLKANAEICLPGSVNESQVLNVLVVPIEFSDYEISDFEKINEAFFGDENSTGWESVSSYYEESSFGKVLISGTVLSPYKINKTSRMFENEHEENTDMAAISEALKAKRSEIADISQYDANNDHVIDAIYGIYAAPYSTDSNSQYWAWQYTFSNSQYEFKIDGYSAGGFVWASESFLDDRLSSGLKVAINTETYIHETGHLLGLDDYYDYLGEKTYLGGADMMDGNIGDHGPFSKVILGWSVPHIVSSPIEIKLSKAELTGQVLLIPKGVFEHSYFSEYLLLDFYSGEGLNSLYRGKGQFSVQGVRIYHVIALVGANSGEEYHSIFTYDNTSDSDFPLVSYVVPSTVDGISDYRDVVNDNMLFKANDKLTAFRWSDGYISNLEIEIISINSESATIRVIYN